MMKEEREIFEDKLKNSLEVVIVGDSIDRLPHISNIQFADINSEVLLIELDLMGLVSQEDPPVRVVLKNLLMFLRL